MDNITSATESLIALWHDVMRNYPSAHDRRALGDLIELLRWFFEDLNGNPLLSNSTLPEDTKNLEMHCEAIGSTFSDRLASAIVGQTHKFFGEGEHHAGGSDCQKGLTMLLLRVLNSLFDEDGRVSMTRTSRALNQLVVRFGKVLVDYVIAACADDPTRLMSHYGLLCISLLFCPKDVESERIRYTSRPSGVYKSYQLLNEPLVTRFEAFIPLLSQKFLEQVPLSMDEMSKLHHWLKGIFHDISLQKASWGSSNLTRKRRCPDESTETEQLSNEAYLTRGQSGLPSLGTRTQSGDLQGKPHAILSSLLHTIGSSLNISLDHEVTSIQRALVASLEKMTLSVLPATRTMGCQASIKVLNELEQSLELLSCLVCCASKKHDDFISLTPCTSLLSLPHQDFASIYKCPYCDSALPPQRESLSKCQTLIEPIFKHSVDFACASGLLAISNKTGPEVDAKEHQVVTSRARLAVIRYLTKVLNHTLHDFSDDTVTPSCLETDLIASCLSILELGSRMERAAASRLLAGVLSTVVFLLRQRRLGLDRACQLELMLSRLEALVQNAHLKVQESLIATLVLCFAAIRVDDQIMIDDGRLKLKACFSYRLLAMVARQMCKKSSYLLGVVRTEILLLSRRVSLSVYNLLARYLPALSQLMVVDLKFDSHGSGVLADLLGMTPNVFLAQTSRYTIPCLVLDSDTVTLQKVSAAKEETVPESLVGHAADIITYLCIQEDLGQFERGLSHFYSYLNDGRGDSVKEQLKVEINTLFQVSAGLIYFRLIVEAPDDPSHQSRFNNIKGTLWRALQLKQLVPEWSKPPDEMALRTELQSQTLPILSHINGSLQNLRGKISIAEKVKVMQGLGALIRLIGAGIQSYIPQIMTSLQASLALPALRTPTLQTLDTFVEVTPLKDLQDFVGQITAILVGMWGQLRVDQLGLVLQTVQRILTNHRLLGSYAHDIADLSGLSIPTETASDLVIKKALERVQEQQSHVRDSIDFAGHLRNLIGRINSESEVVSRQALRELLHHIEVDVKKTNMLIAGDSFDPLIGDLVKALTGVSARCNDASDDLKSLSFECLGAIGAVDPDRFEIEDEKRETVLASNFTDTEESIDFALELIRDQLVGAYRSAHDSKQHHFLTYAIQELLRFCGFTEELVDPEKALSLSTSVRSRWNLLHKNITDSISPLLGSKFKFSFGNIKPSYVPVYKHTSVFSSWLQHWLLRMIPLVEEPCASRFFSPFLGIVRHGDTVISRKLLPHVALHLAVYGSPEEYENMKMEIITVLEDQVNRRSSFSPEGRQLVAQTIFGLMDHFSRWVRDRLKGQAPVVQGGGFKRKDPSSKLDAATLRIQSIISEVSRELIASAASYCKDHARALLNVEQHILSLESPNSSDFKDVAGKGTDELPVRERLQQYYEKVHEIYAAIDDPDGMEGISAKIIAPSILHQIREHESIGRWTSAQSCWEVELQRQPDELRSHLGLLRCLRNLGHYDSLRAHLTGVLQDHPSWESHLAPFAVESCLVSNDWHGLSRAVQVGCPDSPEVIFGKVVDVLLNSHQSALDEAMKDARIRLGNRILGASRKEAYRRVYDSTIYLHILHEVRMIDQACRGCASGVGVPLDQAEKLSLTRKLMDRLESRLDSISPAFRHREQVLRLRRAAFQLRSRGTPLVGQLWIQTAKIARTAGHLQTSYSAVLQASELNAPMAFMQKAKLMKLEDQPYKAIAELDNHLERSASVNDSIAPLGDISHRDYAKAELQRVRWMDEVDRYPVNRIASCFESLCKENPNWASPYYYFGRFYDVQTSQALPSSRVTQSQTRVTRAEYTYHCIRNFQRSLTHGTKFIYQALPRMLTLYFSLGEHPDLMQLFKMVEKRKKGQEIRQDDYTRVLQEDELGAVFIKVDRSMHSAVRKLPVFEWLTVLPQVVSRVMHKSTHVQAVVHKILTHTLRSYPDQALWAMVSGVESSNAARSSRCNWVLNDAKDISAAAKARDSHIEANLAVKIEQCRKLVRQLLKLCNYPIKNSVKQLSLNETLPTLRECAPCDLIIPLQSSLIANLPPHEVNFAQHQPFPSGLPTIQSFADKISIMTSLQKPRKIVVNGSDGNEYPFLCKPKDDLRKDARLMEFNSMINKLLKKDSESRKRNLLIRTYAVVVLNEECGLLEWVVNTVPFRNILVSLYAPRGIPLWNSELKALSEKIRKIRDDLEKVKQVFEKDVLPRFPPVFHQWLLNNFPDPNSWLRSRQAYGRTAAVMSMVGFVLGLGDRHGENILFDSTTGDTVHVDFNCLFDKGRTFEVSENVPFRLTHNMVAALGITGVEGTFRKACEVTMKILRNNKDSLMSVLETFVHDPLVDWMPSGSKRKVDAPTEEYVAREAKRALEPISRKLTGYQTTASSTGKTEREMSTENQVDSLINEARDNRHLGRMYFGWAPYL